MYKWCEGETLKRRVPELEEIRVHVKLLEMDAWSSSQTGQAVSVGARDIS